MWSHLLQLTLYDDFGSAEGETQVLTPLPSPPQLNECSLCDFSDYVELQGLVCMNELVLHNCLARQMKADHTMHCFPNSHSQITVGHAQGFWARNGATLRTHTHTGKKIHSRKGSKRDRRMLLLLFSILTEEQWFECPIYSGCFVLGAHSYSSQLMHE